MSPSPGRILLTDIEGTTSSIAFVREILFPYARRALPEFLATHRLEPAVRDCLEEVATELGGPRSLTMLIHALQGWIDQDSKHPALKRLEGMIWRAGYLRGDYAAHLYPDAARALRRWHGQGHRLYAYSSGSVLAQKLFFTHSSEGDLAPLFSGHFDAQIGAKRDPGAYRRIARAIERAPSEILFLSDVLDELDGAREAGLATALVDRRDDYPEPRLGAAARGHVRVESFQEIALDE